MIYWGVVFAILGFAAYVAYLAATGKRRVKKSDALFFLPLLFIFVAVLYAIFFAAPGECGSQEPGTCFGLLLFVAFIGAPIALFATPAGLMRIWRRKTPLRQPSSNSEDPS